MTKFTPSCFNSIALSKVLFGSDSVSLGNISNFCQMQFYNIFYHIGKYSVVGSIRALIFSVLSG